MFKPPLQYFRWFRFRLRTLFVLLTIFCLWLGYSLHWVRQRRETLAAVQWKWTAQIVPGKMATAPWTLRVFGEEGKGVIFVRESVTEAELDRVRRIFPEAVVTGEASIQVPETNWTCICWPFLHWVQSN